MSTPSVSIGVLSLALASLLAFCSSSTAEDTIRQGDSSLRDAGNGTLLVAGSFVLHFFSPHGTTNRYLAVSYAYKGTSRVVWIANRADPITDRTGVLNISAQGNLNLYQDSSSKLIWSPTTSRAVQAQLLGTGELVVQEPGSDGRYIWSSFEHPTDTMLPGMQIREDRFLTSWRSESDPSPGNFTCRLRCGAGGSCEIYTAAGNGSRIIYRTGPWDATRDRFSGNPYLLDVSDDITFELSSDSRGSYYSFRMRERGRYAISLLVIGASGLMERNATVAADGSVVNLWSRPRDLCDRYGSCGSNGLCRSDGTCGCLPGFVDARPEGEGCRREKSLDCGGSRFEVVDGVKLPETTGSAWVNPNMSVGDCEAACREDCGCVAYARVHIVKKTGEGCIRWSGNLSDIRLFDGIIDPDQLFLKSSGRKSKTKTVIISAVTSSVAVILVVTILGTWLCRMMIHSQSPQEAEMGLVCSIKNTANTNLREELHVYDYTTLASATRDFSDKIGQGGFGIVYKGIMSDGQVVAVKRLSNRISENKMEEFLNEATLIAKLQHKNLVRLLGCCTDRGECMLVYEYMCNRSLDTLIFDEKMRPSIQWERRANIILGISRGLLYLHEDSRLKVIHRDLKAANILLDEDMNPRISDFGTARIFASDQSEDKTMNVIGTLGYISPEYAMDGTFSVKSDVFSFGVVMLEIISGIKNTIFSNLKIYGEEVPDKNLLAMAWRMWNDGVYLKILDEKITSINHNEVQRYIQIALLCVQERVDDRPTMSGVHSMLSNEEKNLKRPNRPGIYQGHVARHIQPSSSGSEIIGQMTITEIEGR